jgi:putative nucleotidyltransferase with HDIG domain
MAEDEAVEYCEVSIEEFTTGKFIPYDIFIRLSEAKYLKIASKGDDLTPERIQGYKYRNVTALYLRKPDYLEYIGFIAEHPEEKDQAAQREVAELCELGNLTVELMFFNEMNEVIFGTARSFVDKTVGLLSDDRHALNLLAPLNKQADFIYGHSVGVSVYCVMIARQMGWTNSANIFRLSLGGLMHDIGKRDIPKEILLKPEKWLSPDDVKLIREHPVRGVKILSSIPSIAPEVLEVVLQHHENDMGKGYPRSLTKQKIHPMANIVAVANGFFNHILTGPNGTGKKPNEAITAMAKSGEFDPEALTALARVFKLENGLVIWRP